MTPTSSFKFHYCQVFFISALLTRMVTTIFIRRFELATPSCKLYYSGVCSAEILVSDSTLPALLQIHGFSLLAARPSTSHNFLALSDFTSPSDTSAVPNTTSLHLLAHLRTLFESTCSETKLTKLLPMQMAGYNTTPSHGVWLPLFVFLSAVTAESKYGSDIGFDVYVPLLVSSLMSLFADFRTTHLSFSTFNAAVVSKISLTTGRVITTPSLSISPCKNNY
ncbi:hypothetical protein F4604DRAFT_1903834 [Suillus subluteus]|nr:hypothetical protein F4604DRAFT_1903834 [Suillus subluteus]